MKEIVVISGKGGTGKTSITASFSMIGASEIVCADCDVDAADMHLLLQPDYSYSEDFYSGELAFIDQDECTECGKCLEKCRFDAIYIENNIFNINDINCEGCAFCSHICPDDAIKMVEQKAGQWFISNTKATNTMIHAKLGIGAENSGKLVAKVKNEARRICKEQGLNFILVDGSPGIGCPVISSITGADYVVLVTEPTVSGVHDLKRVYELVKKFNISCGCIINKYDINTDKTKEIKEYLISEEIDLITQLPYDEAFTKAMTIGKTIIEYKDNNLKNELINSWNLIIKQK